MNDLFVRYNDFLTEYREIKSKVSDINNCARKDVSEFREKFQLLYNNLIDLHLTISEKAIKENIDENNYINFTYKNSSFRNTPKQIISFSEKHANIIQFRYLYPLNIKLNEFAEKEAEEREKQIEERSKEREKEAEKTNKRRFFWSIILSVGISAVIGILVNIFTPWVIHNCNIRMPENRELNSIDKNLKLHNAKTDSILIDTDSIKYQLNSIGNKIEKN